MLTKAQRLYLELAKDGGLSPDAISPGSSFRCVLGLVYRKLLKRSDGPDLNWKYVPTDAGLNELHNQEQ